MSAAAHEAPSLADIDANFRRNVSVVMAGKRIRATAVYRALGLSRQAFSARLNGVTRFTLGESAAIASILDVPIDLLIGSTEQVVAHQNWKQMMGSDQPGRPNMVLAVSRKRAGTRHSQPQLPMLTLVRD